MSSTPKTDGKKYFSDEIAPALVKYINGMHLKRPVDQPANYSLNRLFAENTLAYALIYEENPKTFINLVREIFKEKKEEEFVEKIQKKFESLNNDSEKEKEFAQYLRAMLLENNEKYGEAYQAGSLFNKLLADLRQNPPVEASAIMTRLKNVSAELLSNFQKNPDFKGLLAKFLEANPSVLNDDILKQKLGKKPEEPILAINPMSKASPQATAKSALVRPAVTPKKSEIPSAIGNTPAKSKPKGAIPPHNVDLKSQLRDLRANAARERENGTEIPVPDSQINPKSILLPQGGSQTFVKRKSPEPQAQLVQGSLGTQNKNPQRQQQVERRESSVVSHSDETFMQFKKNIEIAIKKNNIDWEIALSTHATNELDVFSKTTKQPIGTIEKNEDEIIFKFKKIDYENARGILSSTDDVELEVSSTSLSDIHNLLQAAERAGKKITLDDATKQHVKGLMQADPALVTQYPDIEKKVNIKAKKRPT